MARIRTIKPEFFTSSDIVALSPLARLLYIALWCEADRDGRFVWKPDTFKLRYLPGDQCDVFALCKELVDGELVVLYGESFAHVPTFLSHQHVNPRESESVLPVPTRGARVPTRGARAGGKGREGKGRSNDASASIHGFPPGFDAFWTAYPKKVGKDAAAKAFAVRKVDAGLLATILKAVEAQKVGTGWKKDGGQFIPNPATWLNQGRWQDETASPVDDLTSLFARGAN